MQEVWELFNIEELGACSGVEQPTEDLLFLAISSEAMSGGETKKSMQLMGMMQHSVHILIDSGSTSSFASQHVVDQLSNFVISPSHVKVQVANGGVISCSSAYPEAEWSIQGCLFKQQLRVLPLLSYDLIFGMDWLESFSPMKVHWRHKWMVIPYNDTTAVLQGILLAIAEELLIQITSVQAQPSVAEGSTFATRDF